MNITPARKMNVGSVSHGTLRSEDLIESFTYELRQQKPLSREHRKMLREMERRITAHARIERRTPEVEPYFDTDDASEDVNELIDALNCYAPSGFYFGAHPGDGSDFGFWLSETFIEDFDGLRVEDTGDVPRSYRGEVLHVNDHGNTTLYVAMRGKLKEVWGIV
jgi:hypothetical protein